MPAPDPKAEQSSALTWALMAAAFAAGLFLYAGRAEPEKRTFYLVAGGVAAVVAAVNGYAAWKLYNKLKPPTK